MTAVDSISCLHLEWMIHCHSFTFVPLASCGIPFQVLPDYQEGAEQVRYNVTIMVEHDGDCLW